MVRYQTFYITLHYSGDRAAIFYSNRKVRMPVLTMPISTRKLSNKFHMLGLV